jgi:protein SCO1/2
VKRALGEKAEGVRFVLVTVDPERDTPEKLGNYVEQFDPAFLGLTGSPEALQAVYRDYGVYVQKVEAGPAGSTAGYLVDHTARVYAVDKNGGLRLTYPFGMDVAKMAADLTHLLAEK